MSTKSKHQKGTTTPVPSTPGSSTPAPGQRPSSPLSPTRYSRLAEKTELQNLNDRLACYIERVRNLESENSKLIYEVRSVKENINRETSSIKSMYDKEIQDARKLLDETATEKARLEIDAKRLWEENNDLVAKLKKLEKDFTAAENARRSNESRLNDLQGRYNQACTDRKKAQDENKELAAEREKLLKLLEDTRKHLEGETLARVELENANQSLREELAFKDSVHKQEIIEVNSHRQVEISEIDGRLSEQYEAKLQQSLQELRDQYEDQMLGNREEIERLYQDKILNLESALNRNSAQAGNTFEDLRIIRSKVDDLNGKIIELEATIGTLNARNRQLEKHLDDERARHSHDVRALEEELNRLRKDMEAQVKEYQDLMDLKISLDLELAAYDALLKGEEARLNITPRSAAQLSQSLRSSRRTPIHRSQAHKASAALKRKRAFIEEELFESEYLVSASAKGDIEINEADPEGRYVKLHNKSNKEISVGGWQLIRKTGTEETHFKFHRSAKIEGGGFVTVWSSDAGQQHEPPSNILMKQQKWFVAEDMKTTLFNADGEELATSERIKKLITKHVSRHRSGIGGGGEELYHQEGDPASRNSENCFLM